MRWYLLIPVICCLWSQTVFGQLPTILQLGETVVIGSWGHMSTLQNRREMGANNEAYYAQGCMGKRSDSLFVNDVGLYLYPSSECLPCKSCSTKDSSRFRSPKPGEIRITAMIGDTIDVGDIGFNGQDSLMYYMGFPVIIENLSSDTLAIGNGSSDHSVLERTVNLIMQAKDEHGNWQDVEQLFRNENPPFMGLPPDQLVQTGGYIYVGSFETDLRLRMGENYSNVFRGWVNPDAFR